MSLRTKPYTPTAMDPYQVEKRTELLELPAGAHTKAQLMAVDYGIRHGLSHAETKETLLAPLGLTERE